MKFSVTRRILGALLFSVFAASATALPVRAQAPVGMAALVKGQVWALSGDKRTPLRALGRLGAGTRIQTGAGSSAVVVLFGTGARFQIGAGALAEVGEKTVSGAQKMAALGGPSSEMVRLLGQGRVGAISARPALSFQRLSPDAPPFFRVSDPVFEWSSGPGAARYTFTLFDGEDNAVWSVSTQGTRVVYPKDAPQLLARRPYLWRLSAFGNSGKPTTQTRWGWITLLSDEDGKALSSTLSELEAEAKTASDESPFWLQVEAFRSFGVVNGALELLSSKPLNGTPDASGVRDEILDGLSPFSRLLAGRPVAPQTVP